jgi:hypothetical protein
MPETSFSTHHAGASVTCAGGAVIVHLSTLPSTEVHVIEDAGLPLAVFIQKDAGIMNGHDDGLTQVWVDWETACEVARVVDRRREQADHESHPSALRAL